MWATFFARRDDACTVRVDCNAQHNCRRSGRPSTASHHRVLFQGTHGANVTWLSSGMLRPGVSQKFTDVS